MKTMILLFILLTSAAFAGGGEGKRREPLLDKLIQYQEFIYALVQGSLDSRGLSPETILRPNLPSYRQVAVNIDKQLQQSSCFSTDCDGYIEDLSRITGSPVGKTHEMKLLPDAESFHLRRDLLLKAKKSIFVLVWAVYNDETGDEFSDLLLEALNRNPDIDIRIIVDGNIVNLKGRRLLKELGEKSGGRIKVMKWKSRRYRANGNHRKLMVIDTEHVIVGGMNIGNNYSHMGSDDKWRDLDVYLRGGDAPLNAQNQFAAIWNKQIDEFPKLRQKLGTVKETMSAVGSREGQKVLFVDQHPGSAVNRYYHNIHTAMVKLFRDARKSIDIENAYFIMDPIIKSEIKAALKRGIKVRIFTNSDVSVDEKVISMAIMHSAREALIMGAEIYLRQTTNLHSKYMIVDGEISVIGSFNFHPRSLRFDAENVAVIFDKELGLELTQHFEDAIEDELHINDPSLFKINWDLIGFLTHSFYFDFL
jgi:cardiolipin synthase